MWGCVMKVFEELVRDAREQWRAAIHDGALGKIIAAMEALTVERADARRDIPPPPTSPDDWWRQRQAAQQSAWLDMRRPAPPEPRSYSHWGMHA